ncbi:MAG: undecaprenyl-diphosphate phosphatase [Lachnospiraceae bacterium]|nr:undecaprenyl-diphosphate phosphatase [Lachnospiraceae bacterium]
MGFVEILKIIFYGFVEGITEWLPISSTGHLILFEELLPLKVSPAFLEMFRVVIQLGAILAVVLIFFRRLNPFSSEKSEKAKRGTWGLWLKIIVGCIPAGVLGLLLDDWFDEHFYNWPTVAVALIVYGVLFIVLEKRNRGRQPAIRSYAQMSLTTALVIGCFQALALIPGTSRSGATILGAMILGLSRPIAAEYSFFLSVPVMAGASLVKVLGFIKHGAAITGPEVAALILGTVTAFLVSLFAIKFLVGYVKKHDFTAFGIYRIVLGVLVILYFLILK